MEFNALRDILVKVLGVAPDEVTEDANFFEDLAADSLDLYQVILEMEEQFHIELKEDEIQKITTVKEAVAYIKDAKK